MASNLGSAILELATDDSALRSGLNSANALIQKFGAEADHAVSGAGKGFSILSGSVASLIGNLASSGIQAGIRGVEDLGKGIFDLGVSAIKANGDLEQTAVAFKVLTGSASEANAEIKVLQQYADHTSFTFNGVKQAALDLQTAGLTAKQAEGEITRLGDAVAAMGGGDELLKQVSEDVAQVAVKGHLAGQEVLQFANAGIPMVQILADRFGKTKDQIDTMISAGLIPATTAIGVLNDYIGTKFQGAAEAQSHTFNGMISTLQDWFNRALQIVGQPLFEKLKPKLEEFLNFLSQPSTMAALAKFGENLGTFIGNAIDWITNTAIPSLVQAWPTITAIIGDAGSIIVSAASTFATIASYAISWGSGIISALADGIYAGAQLVIEAVQFIASIITDLLETHSPPKVLPDLPIWGRGAIQSWINGMRDGDFSVFDEITDTVKGYLTSLSDVGKFGKGGIVPAVFGTEQAMTRLLDQLKETGTVSQESLDAVVRAAGPAGETVRGLVEAEVDANRAARDLESAHNDVARATQDVADAQDNLTRVTQQYADELDPLNAQLKDLQEQERAITEQRDEAKLGRDLSPERQALEDRRKTLELQKAQQDIAKSQADTTLKTAQLQAIVDAKGASSTEGKKALADIASLQTETALKQVQDQQRINDLQDAANDKSQTQLDTLKLQQLQQQDKIDGVTKEKDAAEKLAQQQVDAAKKEQDAAKNRETQAQKVADAANKQITAQKNIVTEMEKQNSLLAEQAKTVASLAGGAGGGGGGGGKGKGGGGAGLGLPSGDGGLLGNLKTQLTGALGPLEDTKTKLGNLINMSGLTDFKKNLDNIATGFKGFTDGLDTFLKQADPVVKDFTRLIAASLDPNAKSTGNGILDMLTNKDHHADRQEGDFDLNAAIDKVFSDFMATQKAQSDAIDRSRPQPNSLGYQQYVNGDDKRNATQSVDQSGAFIPPQAADMVTSQQDAIANQKKIYQSVADWMKGPEAQGMARKGWDTLFKVAPGAVDGFAKQAGDIFTVITGGKVFDAATAQNAGRLADHYSVMLDNGKAAVDAGMDRINTTHRTKLEAMNQTTDSELNKQERDWNKSYDTMSTMTSTTMAQAGINFGQKLTGMTTTAQTWGVSILGTVGGIWDRLTGVTKDKSTEMAKAHSDALIKMNQDSDSAYAAQTSTVTKGMDDEAAVASAGMGTINSDMSLGFGKTSQIVEVGMQLAKDRYTLKMSAMSEDNKTKLTAFNKSWEDSYSSIPTTVQTHLEAAKTTHGAKMTVLNTANDVALTALKKGWEDNFASLAPIITAKAPAVKTAATGIADTAKAALVVSAVEAAIPGANLVLGYISGINSKAQAAANAASSLAQTTNRAFTAAQQIASPSRVWEGFGRNIVEGLTQGIAIKIDDPVSAIGDMTDRMAWQANQGATKVGTALDAIQDRLPDFGKALNLADPARQGWYKNQNDVTTGDPKSILFGNTFGANRGDINTTVADTQGAITPALTDTATAAVTPAQTVGQAVVQGIADGITRNLGILDTAFATLRTALMRNIASLQPTQFGNSTNNGALAGGLIPTQNFGNSARFALPAGIAAPASTSKSDTYNIANTFNNAQQPVAELQREFERFTFLRTAE